MSEITIDIRERMMDLLKFEEDKTDLEGLSVISRVGMKVVSSKTVDIDADAVSASCTALIDLGIRLTNATNHGSLTELILHNNKGYSIVEAINDEYIFFCGMKSQLRIGYYLGYLKELAMKLRILISGGELTELAMAIEESKAQKVIQQQAVEEAAATATPSRPSVEQDKAALDGLLNFLDDWDAEEKAAMGVVEEFEDIVSGSNIVGIPTGAGASDSIPQSKESVGIPQETASKPQPQFKVYDDEVPPVPIDDYTPMEIEEEEASTATPAAQPVISTEKLPPLDELPSFDDISVPDFDSIGAGTEYDTTFVLDEESGALDSVLKDLGWDEE